MTDAAERFQPGLHAGSCIVDNEQEYLSNGLRLLKVASLHFISRCNPNAEEVELFTTAGIETLKETNAAFLTLHEVVEVVSGDHAGTRGRVVSLSADSARASVQVKGIPEALHMGLNEIRRCFEVGDYIQIRLGYAKGATGFITNVSENYVTVAGSEDAIEVCKSFDIMKYMLTSRCSGCYPKPSFVRKEMRWSDRNYRYGNTGTWRGVALC